jgi:hypothetical protein
MLERLREIRKSKDFILKRTRGIPAYCILKKTQLPESMSELYRSSDRSLSETFADRGFHVVSVTDPYGGNLGFLDWSR